MGFESMTYMKRTIYYCCTLLFTASLFLSCGQNSKQATNFAVIPDSIFFFKPSKLGGNLSDRPFIIEARFTECSEWGRHREFIRIYTDEQSNFHARYLKFPVNCDSIVEQGYSSRLKPVFDKEIILDSKNKQSINDYLLRLTRSKIKVSFPGHAGHIFTACNADSSFFIQVYDNKLFCPESYQQLIDELF